MSAEQNLRSDILRTVGRGLVSVVSLGLSAAIASVLTPSVTQAQVVYSATVQEVYDSNVFLESGHEIPTPADPAAAALITNANDGKRDSDFLTNPLVGVSGGTRLSRYTDFSGDVRGGIVAFAKNSSLNRFMLDSLLQLKSTEAMMPKPYQLTLSSAFNSGQASVGTAPGTAAEMVETHTASLDFTVSTVDLGSGYGVSGAYGLHRVDYLGQFLFSKSDQPDFLQPQGSDYFDNRFNVTFTKNISPKTDIVLSNDLDVQNFTSVQDTGVNAVVPGARTNSDLNRLTYTPALGFDYRVNERLSTRVRAGMDYVYYLNDPGMHSVTYIDTTGLPVTFEDQTDRGHASFMFDAGASYLLSKMTVASLQATQRTGTDINGERILTRTFNLNLSQQLIERLSMTAGGGFTQWTASSSYSNLNDQYNAVVSLNYAITDALALNLGYNYTHQKAGTNLIDTVQSIGTGDYDSHRVFLTLSGGLVGLPGSL